MPLHSTLNDLLDSQLSSDLVIEFIHGQDQTTTLTPAQLKSRAGELLALLQARGMKVGDELVIHTQSNEDFVIAFWAAVLGGLVPVPVAVGISDEHRNKLLRIVGQLRSAYVFTTADLSTRLHEFAESHDSMPVVLKESARWITSIEDNDSAPTELSKPTPDDLAFIQYSSGSTGDPKGVCLTHKNVTTNVRAIIEAGGWGPEDKALSWMPLTHDMGLIGFHLSVLAAGMHHAIMDTSAFVRRPKLWLSMAAERKSTILCSPNFGYQHYLKAVERKGIDDIDLSHVRQMLNGAEPISRALCDTFNATLASTGLPATAMRPVYGLAEATVGVSFSKPGTLYTSTRIHRESVAIGARIEAVTDDEGIDLVHVGPPIRDVQLRLVDDNDAEIAASIIGHLQLKGDSVTERIYGDEQTTQAMFTADGWLRTGDSGALVSSNNGEPELMIVGRIKDVLISNGQNFYAHDIENAVSSTSGAELGKVAVASVRLPEHTTEQIAVFVLFRKELADFASLAKELRAEISAKTGLEADLVVPVPRIPKTTSGKIQRHQLAQTFMRGEFDHTLEAEGVTSASSTEASESNATEAGSDVCSQLVSIASEFVTEGQIGPDDNLFEAGVSSLTLTEISLAIEERFPGKLDVSDLFDYPTLREIATWVQRD
ncbi:MAG: non-ribosomal peptide synthetase [Gammaproteobacteria bacterium]